MQNFRRNDQENPPGIETGRSCENAVSDNSVATTKKTRQGLKLGKVDVICGGFPCRRNDQENPPGIETTPLDFGRKNISSCRNDQENPPGIETINNTWETDKLMLRRNDQENPPGIETTLQNRSIHPFDIVATTKKTRQGLKLRWAPIAETRSPVATTKKTRQGLKLRISLWLINFSSSRNDQENPPGIET